MPASSSALSTYWELTVPASAACADALTNFLWELGALGVVEEDLQHTMPRLRAFFPSAAEPGTLAARVRAYVEGLVALGLGPSVEPRVAALVDDGWADAWRDHFKPISVGRRLVIAPPWNTPFARDRIVVVIEPGRAFGTGHHGSTAGCLEALEALVESAEPEHAIDLGTGSGIVAIAAARLGVRRILAVDEDPDAVAAAVANAATNGVADRVRCRLAEASTVDAAPAPLVIANLLTAAHRRLARRYRDLVAPSGALVLGGILDAEGDVVGDAMGREGFTLAERRSLDGWTTLVLTREREGAVSSLTAR